jgi:DNA-binding IclR family transcriptional regulator
MTEPKVTRTLSRGLAILDVIASADDPMTATEIAHAVGLDKATTGRLLRTLVAEGYVAHRTDRRFELTGRVLLRSRGAEATAR